MTPSGPVRPTAGGVHIDLKVMPRSARSAIEGVRSARLLVRVTSAPVDNAANDAVIELLAGALGVPKRAIQVRAGSTSRQKTLAVTGIDAATAMERLGITDR